MIFQSPPIKELVKSREALCFDWDHNSFLNTNEGVFGCSRTTGGQQTRRPVRTHAQIERTLRGLKQEKGALEPKKKPQLWRRKCSGESILAL